MKKAKRIYLLNEFLAHLRLARAPSVVFSNDPEMCSLAKDWLNYLGRVRCYNSVEGKKRNILMCELVRCLDEGELKGVFLHRPVPLDDVKFMHSFLKLKGIEGCCHDISMKDSTKHLNQVPVLRLCQTHENDFHCIDFRDCRDQLEEFTSPDSLNLILEKSEKIIRYAQLKQGDLASKEKPTRKKRKDTPRYLNLSSSDQENMKTPTNSTASEKCSSTFSDRLNYLQIELERIVGHGARAFQGLNGVPQTSFYSTTSKPSKLCQSLQQHLRSLQEESRGRVERQYEWGKSSSTSSEESNSTGSDEQTTGKDLSYNDYESDFTTSVSKSTGETEVTSVSASCHENIDVILFKKTFADLTKSHSSESTKLRDVGTSCPNWSAADMERSSSFPSAKEEFTQNAFYFLTDIFTNVELKRSSENLENLGNVGEQTPRIGDFSDAAKCGSEQPSTHCRKKFNKLADLPLPRQPVNEAALFYSPRTRSSQKPKARNPEKSVKNSQRTAAQPRFKTNLNAGKFSSRSKKGDSIVNSCLPSERKPKLINDSDANTILLKFSLLLRKICVRHRIIYKKYLRALLEMRKTDSKIRIPETLTELLTTPTSKMNMVISQFEESQNGSQLFQQNESGYSGADYNRFVDALFERTTSESSQTHSPQIKGDSFIASIRNMAPSSSDDSEQIESEYLKDDGVSSSPLTSSSTTQLS